MPDDLRVNGWLVIPAGELHERFSRSSGPGGQSVNTADTRVELSFDIAHSAALPEYARERALSQLAGRLTDGVLTVVASEQRSQLLNRRAARGRLANLLRGRSRRRGGPAFPPGPAAPRASAGWPTNGAAARSSGTAAPIPATPNEPVSGLCRGRNARRAGTLTTVASWVERAITTTASVSENGFSSRCGTCGGPQT